MNIWENTVITEKGLSLQAKLIEGTSLIITRAVSGTGYVTPALLQKQTAVSGEKQTLAFRTVTYPSVGKCAVPVVLKNDGLTEGYMATQIGIYAEDPDEGEILYLISQAENGTGTEVPSEEELASYSASWTFYMQYGHADNVTVVVDPSDAITIDILEAHLKNKADVDFKNVTNLHFLIKAIESGAANPIATTQGTGAAYTAEIPGVTELYPGFAFTMIPHVTSTTNAPTLNLNGLGAKPIRQPLTTNTAATTTASLDTWLSQGTPVRVMYTGSLWRIDIPRPSAASLYGAVKIENGGTGAETLEGAQQNLGITALVTRVDGHVENKNNPHEVDATQVLVSERCIEHNELPDNCNVDEALMDLQGDINKINARFSASSSLTAWKMYRLGESYTSADLHKQELYSSSASIIANHSDQITYDTDGNITLVDPQQVIISGYKSGIVTGLDKIPVGNYASMNGEIYKITDATSARANRVVLSSGGETSHEGAELYIENLLKVTIVNVYSGGVISEDANAYPDNEWRDGVLYVKDGTAFSLIPSVETGTYKGNGLYGEGSPNHLTFTIKPLAVFVSGLGTEAIFIRDSTYSNLDTTWYENGISWSAASGNGQLNNAATTYRYLAIGQEVSAT